MMFAFDPGFQVLPLYSFPRCCCLDFNTCKTLLSMYLHTLKSSLQIYLQPPQAFKKTKENKNPTFSNFILFLLLCWELVKNIYISAFVVQPCFQFLCFQLSYKQDLTCSWRLSRSLLFKIDFFFFCFSFSSISDPFIFNLCHKEHVVGDQRCFRYSYHDIKEIRLMRFLLQVGTNMLGHLSESCCSSKIMWLKNTCIIFTKTVEVFLSKNHPSMEWLAR